MQKQKNQQKIDENHCENVHNEHTKRINCEKPNIVPKLQPNHLFIWF